MKTINVDSHNVPATARSKNYQTALATTAASGGGTTTPSVVTPTGGAADTAKVAQNLAEDSTDWAKILRKDIDERTENALSVGKNLTVDGQALLNDVVANTGTFGGLLKAASATIVGGLVASTVNATTINSTTFFGELQGNASTATQLKTTHKIFGNDFNGNSDVDGLFRNIINGYGQATFKSLAYPTNPYGLVGYSYPDGSYGLQSQRESSNEVFPLLLNPNGGNVGIGNITPAYKLDVNGNARITSDLYADATVGTRNFASRTVGWQVNAQGAADFRNIYADELRVQAFTADISQALAGSDYLTKSVSKLSANFVVPSVNSSVRIIVDDIEGMPATRCFTNGDYIRFRAFNRTSGLTIANVWGTVTLDTTFGTNGFSNGTQAYTFTCTATSGAGLTVFKGSEVLDYGISGSGMISRTTLDAMGSPYEQIATWVNDPSNGNNYTVHARLGNLGGIANCSGYGLYTDNGFFTGKIIIGDLTKNANFLSFDTVNGLQIKLGSTSVATTTDVNNSLTTANTNAQGYANTAQTTAINTASSDATTKANTAYGNAVAYTNSQISATNNSITAAVNGIQIGGRNLVVGTSTPKTLTASFSDYYNFYYSFFHLEANKDYVFSCEVDCPTWGDDNDTDTVSAFMMKDGGYSYFIYINSDSYTKLSTGLYRNTHVFQVTQSGNYIIRLDVNHNGSTHTFSSVMVTEGNKAASWSPAPEDVDASIAMAQSNAISTAATNAAALYVTQTAYNAEVTILQNSISSKVSQTDFNALGTRVGTAESNITQNAHDITSKVSSTDYTGNNIASLINQTATTIQIQASKINLVGAVTFSSFDSSTQNTINAKADTSTVNQQVSNAITTASTDATNKVNGIQVGGRNLLLNSSLKTYSIHQINGTFTENIITEDGFANVHKIECTASGIGFYSEGISSSLRNIGDVFTLSMYIKGNSSFTINPVGIEGIKNISLQVSTSWSKIVMTGTVTSNTQTALIFYYGWQTGNILYLRDVKVERGTKATDWSPAPEDVDSSISTAQQAAQTYATTNCVQVGLSNAPDAIKNQVLAAAHGNFTYINGSSIYTGTLNANQVTAGYISADRIGANTITFDKLVGSDITALGNVTAGSFNIGSGKFVVDPNGSLTAADATIIGKITATEGSVGPFTISQLDGLTATSGDQSLLLKARLIRFTGGTTSAVYIGTDVVPGSWGGSFTCPVRVEESRPTTTSGNVGIYLSVTGASVSDSTDYISNSALFINKGVITGFRTRQRRLNYSQTLSLLDTTIIDTSVNNDSTYTLPVPNEDGQRYEFITTDRYIKIKPSAGQTLQYGTDQHFYTSSEYATVTNGNYAICIYNAVSSRWIMRDSRGS